MAVITGTDKRTKKIGSIELSTLWILNYDFQ